MRNRRRRRKENDTPKKCAVRPSENELTTTMLSKREMQGKCVHTRVSKCRWRRRRQHNSRLYLSVTVCDDKSGMTNKQTNRNSSNFFFCQFVVSLPFSLFWMSHTYGEAKLFIFLFLAIAWRYATNWMRRNCRFVSILTLICCHFVLLRCDDTSNRLCHFLNEPQFHLSPIKMTEN